MSEELPAGSSSSSIREERMKRLKSLHTRRNEARKLNHVEVVEEDRRNKLPANYESKKRRQDWELEEMEKRKEAEEKGEDYDRIKMMNMQADMADKLDQSKRRKKNPDFGFGDFEAATVRQYDRLTKQLKPDSKEYEEMRKQLTQEEFFPTANTLIQGSHYPSTDQMDRMVNDLQKQDEKRSKFSRRRTYDPDGAVDFINERNRKFNEKIDRFYSKYTDEIKQNLERGTAV